MRARPRHFKAYFQEGARLRAPEPAVRAATKIGRNEPCHCGSGLKYKKCCLDADNEPYLP